jgi:hypothetical protein
MVMNSQVHRILALDHLPPDILICIMTTYREAFVVFEWDGDSRDKICCPLIYTCRYIYSVAISTPELWTYVDMKWSDQWLDLCLSRAQSSSLNLGARAWGLGSRHISDKYEELLTRSSDASIALPYSMDVDRPEAISYMTAPLVNPMPRLRRLDIFANHDCLYNITPQFLGGSCSRLTSLSLSLVTIESSTPEFPALRLLWLGSVVTSLPVFRAMICKTPALEHLQIYQIDCPEFQNQDALNTITRLEQGPAHLPNLMTLEMQHTKGALVSLLYLIPLPRHRLGLTAFGNCESGSKKADAVLTSIVHNFWQAATSDTLLPPVTLRITSYIYPKSGSDEDEDEEEEDDEEEEEEQEQETERGELEFRLELGEFFIFPWTDILTRTFTRPSVFMSINSGLQMEYPPALLDKTQLDSIQLRTSEGHQTLLRLATPLLDRLLGQISHLTIGAAYTHLENEEIELWPPETQEDLTELMRRIQDRHVALKTLTFVACHPALKVIGDDLRDAGCVEEVIWDESHGKLAEMYGDTRTHMNYG